MIEKGATLDRELRDRLGIESLHPAAPGSKPTTAATEAG